MDGPSLPATIRTLLQPDIASKNLILTTAPIPNTTPGSDEEHLIKVHATCPCAGELLWALNFPALLSTGKTLVPCFDLAGTVVTAPASSPFKPGDEIYTRTDAARTGNAREYTIALTSELARKPQSLDWVQAASVPLSALAAFQALFEHGGLAGLRDEKNREENRKKKVLVTAAAGGVGVWVVQLARAAGVGQVVGVCGTENVEFVHELGATDVVDYKKMTLGEWVGADESKKADLIIDCVGKKTLEECWGCVKDGGTLLSIVEPPEGRKPVDCKAKDVRNLFFIMQPIGKQLDEVTELVDEGRCRPVVDSVWELDEFEQAFKRVDSGHARGKVVLKISS